MTPSQLSDDDRSLLIWLVEETRQRRLEGEFIVLWTADSYILQGYTGARADTPSTLTHERLARFVEADLVIRRVMPRGSWRCILRKNAYIWVARNFED